MENINLLEYEIADLDFHLPQDGWPNSVNIETEFGVRINEQEKNVVLLEIKQEINYETVAAKEPESILRVSIIGLAKIENSTGIGKKNSDTYRKGFRLLYKKLRRKLASFEKLTRIQFPPMPKWEDFNEKEF